MTLQQMIDVLLNFRDEGNVVGLPDNLNGVGDLSVTLVTSKSRGMVFKDIYRSRDGIEIEVGHE